MKLRIYILSLFLAVACISTSCITDKSANDDKSKDNFATFVPRVEEENTVSWRHVENLPKIRPIVAVLRGVLNDNWDRMQYQFELNPFDFLANFKDVFLQASLKDVIVMPVRSSPQEVLAYSGNQNEIISKMTEQIKKYNFNTGFLMRIDYYNPGIKYSLSGKEYNPEIKLTYWFINSEGKKIWSAQTSIRTVKPLPKNVAIDHEQSIYALLKRSSEEITSEFAKFWLSPEVVARMQSAKIVKFNIPEQPRFDSGNNSKTFTPDYSKPTTGGATTLKEAGFTEEGD